MALEMLNPAGQADPQGAPSEEAAAPVGQPPVDPIQVSMAEAKKNRQMLDASIERMRNSLEKRNKAPFDPMLMRIAAEAGKPTKTGSFYESLGNVAGGVLDQHASDQKLRQENELKLEELIQKSALMRNKQLALDASGRIVQGGGPGMGAGPGGKAEANAPGRFITAEDIQRISLIDPDVGERLMKLGEYGLKYIKETKDGIYDIRNPGQPLIRFDQPAVDTNLPFIGSVKVPPSVRDRVYAVRDEGKKQGWDIKRYKSELAKVYAEEGIGSEFIDDVGNITMGGPKPTGAAPALPGAPVTGAAGAPTGGAPSADRPTLLNPQTVKTNEKYAEGEVTANLAERKEVGDRFHAAYQVAPQLKNLAKQNIESIKSPATRAVLGKLTDDPTLGAQFLALLSGGVSGPGGRYEVPGIQDFATRLGSTKEERNAYLIVLQNAAEIGLHYRKLYLAGSGPVTDAEQALASRLAPGAQDSAETYLFKSEMLKARSTLDEQRHAAYEKWKDKPENKQKSGRAFYQSQENKTLSNQYDKWLSATYSNFFKNEAPLIPKSHSGKPGQTMGPLEGQIR